MLYDWASWRTAVKTNQKHRSFNSTARDPNLSCFCGHAVCGSSVDSERNWSALLMPVIITIRAVTCYAACGVARTQLQTLWWFLCQGPSPELLLTTFFFFFLNCGCAKHWVDDDLVVAVRVGDESCFCPLFSPRSGELRTQKLKSHLLRTPSLKVLPLKPGVGRYIAIHATLTARDFFLANFYPSGPFTCIFSKISPEFFLW